MKSKLFSRIASIALGVVMLGTVAFANEEAVLTDGADSITVTSPEYGELDNQVTLLAYAVDETVSDVASIPAFNGTQAIVAVEQADPATGFTTVKFNRNNILADKNVAVVLGGNEDGSLLKSLLLTNDIHFTTDILTNQAPKNSIVIGEGEEAIEYVDAVAYVGQYTPAANSSVEEITVTFKSSKEGATPIDVNTAFNQIEGGATIEFKAVVLGIPASYFADDAEYTITVDRAIDVEGNIR